MKNISEYSKETTQLVVIVTISYRNITIFAHILSKKIKRYSSYLPNVDGVRAKKESKT